MVEQVRALLRQPEMVVGTWRAARTTAPDVGEQEVLLALERIERKRPPSTALRRGVLIV